MPQLCHNVRGSYSAWVPRSSLASVHRVFVLHIVEKEAGDQENEKRRQDSKKKKRRIAESQNNHVMITRGWDGVKCALHAKLEPMSM